MNPDVVIVGGGMTGAALALALGRADFTVSLVERGQPSLPAGDQAVGLRVSTLSPATMNLLRNLKVWESLAAERVQAFDSMCVWEDDPDAPLVFKASDAGLDVLGHVAENQRVQGALWQALEDCAAVTLLAGDDVELAEIGERGGRVRLASGKRLRARLLVAADGAGSRMRDHFDIGVERWSYEQRGVVAVVSTEAGHQHTAWQRFLPSGPLALLPLSTGESSIVWSQSTEQAEQRLALSDSDFEQSLTEATQARLGVIRLTSKRASFPLARQRAERYIDDGLALIGDAAHVIHPLAGQGANLGFLDVASLVEVVVEARKNGEDFGARGVLRRYERWRRADNELMADAMSAIKAFYSMDSDPFPSLRTAGAGLLNRSEFARARLIEHASGFGGKVPELVRNSIEM